MFSAPRAGKQWKNQCFCRGGKPKNIGKINVCARVEAETIGDINVCARVEAENIGNTNVSGAALVFRGPAEDLQPIVWKSWFFSVYWPC